MQKGDEEEILVTLYYPQFHARRTPKAPSFSASLRFFVCGIRYFFHNSYLVKKSPCLCPLSLFFCVVFLLAYGNSAKL